MWASYKTTLFSSELTYNIKNPSNGTISTTGQDSEIWNISKEIEAEIKSVFRITKC